MKLNKLAGLISLLFVSRAWAIEPFVIKDIRVEGIQRTEAGTVFSYLPVKVGDTMSDTKSSEVIRALYSTGFFKDVRLEVEQGVLIVLVNERPSIASIEVNGVKSFPTSQIKDNMKYAGLAEARIFDKGVLDKAVQELKRRYVAYGKYGVSVTPTVTDLERNRVAIVFNVVEGEVSKIKQINLVGNSNYSEDELLGLMKLSTPNWMSWLSKNDQYSKQKLSADMEALRSFYMDNGFLEFNFDSTQVSITPDKKDIYITLNFTEGERYKVASVDMKGNSPVPMEELEKLVAVKPGDTFSRTSLTETSKKIAERLGQDGYAFANVNAIPQIDKEKHEVAFTFVVDPGQRVYIRRINIAGNDRTRDEVIRREFRLVEGAWFDVDKVKRSKQRVDKLGFFDSVDMETPPVQGASDQMDVNVTVQEKSTGNFSIGAGYSNGEGVTFTTGITQSNLFGSGNYAALNVNTSRVNQVYSFSYTNPYYTDDGVSRGFDIYKRNTDLTSTAVTQYGTHTKGAGVRYGVPIGEEESFSFGLSAENTVLILGAAAPQRLTQYVQTNGASNSNLMSTIGWTRDTRDSVIYTTQGMVQSAFLEVALPAFDMRYYKLNLQQQWFKPITSDITFLFNGEAGVAGGYANKSLPFFKNFYAGGTGSVRGYETASLGPRDVNNMSLGGTRRVIGNLELMMPLPGLSKEKSVRLSGFIDGGAVYGPGDLPGTAGLRYSSGVAFTWISPMGPIKLSYGIALNKQPQDKLQRFQFTLGQMF